MSFNPYLNLRFINHLNEPHFVPFSAPELYWATQTCQSEVLAYTERLLRQDKVSNYTSLKNYLISMRDTNAWKIGAFKFFYNYNKSHPNAISCLSLKNDSSAMENFIDEIEINPNLADYYEECGHDPHLAMKYSVSKIICDERRLNWMNTFCDKFASILEIAADTGIVASNLIKQLDLVDCAFSIGIINQQENDDLLKTCGDRIIKMFPSWGSYLAAFLLCRLYDICLSAAEVRYLPRQAQTLIDSYYLCCNNRLNEMLPVPGWEHEDLSKLREALKPLVNAEVLDTRWNGVSEYEIVCINRLTDGFWLFEKKLLPYIREHNLHLFIKESGKFDEFIPIVGGRDFNLYLKTLHLPLVNGEVPLMLTKYGLFSNLGFWTFDTYPNPKFAPWPESLTVDAGMPVNRDYGHISIPFFIHEFQCDINVSLPHQYTCNSLFLKKTPPEQSEYIRRETEDLRLFFSTIPSLLKQDSAES